MRLSALIAIAGLSLFAADAALATGCLTNQNNVVLDSTATLNLQLGGTAPCTGYDEYSVGGTLTLIQPTLDVTLTNSFVPGSGESFRLLSWGSLSGTFGTVTLPTLSAGLTWNTSALYTTGTISVNGPSSGGNTDGPLPLWAIGALGAGLVGIASWRVKKVS